jgi:predicted nucleic acid-binding protein
LAALPLQAVPLGTDILIDANIFIYAFLHQSEDCRGLLLRCARQDVSGVATLDTVSEATHRLMCAEAAKSGIIAKETRNPAAALKRRPDAVAGLRAYWIQTQAILSLNLSFLQISEDHVRAAQSLRASYGLLTRDSLLVAAMHESGLTSLASNDSDFDRVPGLIRYRPTDVASTQP